MFCLSRFPFPVFPFPQFRFPRFPISLLCKRVVKLHKEKKKKNQNPFLPSF